MQVMRTLCLLIIEWLPYIYQVICYKMVCKELMPSAAASACDMGTASQRLQAHA